MTPGRPTSAALALLATLGITLAACTGSGGSSPSSAAPSPATSPGASGSTATADCGTAPQPSDMSAWGPPKTAPALLPLLVTNYVACGRTRLLFLYLDKQNNVKSAPDRTLKASFYDLGKDTGKPTATADGAFMWTIENERGMYAVNVELPEAGTWGVELTTEAPGSTAETTRLTFEVHNSSPTVRIGDKAPASKTPTLADVGGDARKISTDPTPDPAFYQTSVADALAAHKPFMLIFATPKFCTSSQCGPTLEHFKTIAKDHPDVTFINVEPYQLKDASGQLQPVRSDTGAFQPTAVTDQWGLLSEPWIFAVDRAGIVQGSYEVLASQAELDAIFPVITKGG
jgi:hypothetical protein